jgi:hypothetical protein
MTERERVVGGGGGGERWKAAMGNLTEMETNLDSLQKFLSKKAVFVEEETFSRASLASEQARSIKVSDLTRFISTIYSNCSF